MEPSIRPTFHYWGALEQMQMQTHLPTHYVATDRQKICGYREPTSTLALENINGRQLRRPLNIHDIALC